MIIFAAYRNWAINACNNFKENTVLVSTDENLKLTIEQYDRDIEAIIFVGWSSIVASEVVNNYLCMCYHPSNLPMYRGGSPLQHQIIDGILETKCTLFKMDTGIDTGPIFEKEVLSLSGDLEEIFIRMENTSIILIEKFIRALRSGSELIFKVQANELVSYCKRRTPSMSEITIKEIVERDGQYLYNKIRALGDPYPNAYIRTSDGKMLLIKKAKLL